MSLGALELQSLFRKYQGDLADIDLSEHNSNRMYGQTKRDLSRNRMEGRAKIADNAASRGLSHSGLHLKQQTDLEKAYERSGADADAQQKANLANIARQRINSEASYNEGVALSKMQSLLQKQMGEF